MLSRLALRLAAIEAIKADPVLAPLHGGRVYDSRMGEFDVSEPSPVIVVYTDDVDGEAFSANNGGVAFDAACELVIEIGVRMIEDLGESPGLATPVTDRGLEAALDLIEYRAQLILTAGEGPWPRAIRKACRRFTRATSKRFRDEELGERLAVRELTLRAMLFAEDDLSPGTGTFAALPDPLRTVCNLATPGTDLAAQCTLLQAGLAAGVPVNALLEGTDLTFIPETAEGLETQTPAEFEAAAKAGDYDADTGTGTQFGATAGANPDP